MATLILGQFTSRNELKININVYINVKLDLLKKFFEIPPYELKEYNNGDGRSKYHTYFSLCLQNGYYYCFIAGYKIALC